MAARLLHSTCRHREINKIEQNPLKTCTSVFLEILFASVQEGKNSVFTCPAFFLVSVQLINGVNDCSAIHGVDGNGGGGKHHLKNRPGALFPLVAALGDRLLRLVELIQENIIMVGGLSSPAL